MQARTTDQVALTYFPFSNGNSSAFENRLDSGYSFASAPSTKTLLWRGSRNGRRRAETAGQQHDFANYQCRFDLCLVVKGEVRNSPERSARPSAAADSEKQQMCVACLFAESVGLYKDDGLMLSPLQFRSRGVGGRGRDLTWHPAVKHQSHKQRQVRPRSGPSKGAHTWTKNS